MIEIIKSGAKKFVATCGICGCKFSYGIEDTVHGSIIHCPECGEPISHNSSIPFPNDEPKEPIEDDTEADDSDTNCCGYALLYTDVNKNVKKALETALSVLQDYADSLDDDD